MQWRDVWPSRQQQPVEKLSDQWRDVRPSEQQLPVEKIIVSGLRVAGSTGNNASMAACRSSPRSMTSERADVRRRRGLVVGKRELLPPAKAPLTVRRGLVVGKGSGHPLVKARLTDRRGPLLFRATFIDGRTGYGSASV